MNKFIFKDRIVPQEVLITDCILNPNIVGYHYVLELYDSYGFYACKDYKDYIFRIKARNGQPYDGCLGLYNCSYIEFSLEKYLKLKSFM